MKNSLIKKLLAAIILCSSLITNGYAQVLYTNVKPDTSLSANGSFYNLDINKDGIIDFKISIASTEIKSPNCSGKKTNRYFRITPLGNNAVLDSMNLPRHLTLNEIIQSTANTWTNDSAQVFVKDAWRCTHILGWGWINQRIGFWIDTLPNYTALKINVAGKTYYGWLKVKITATSFIIQEYACNLKSDQVILAGQATSSYITTSVVTQTSSCAGKILNVAYTAYGSFNAQNVFTAEMSDSLGSFNNPISIGQLSSGTSGTIVAAIPLGTVFSTMYRVRAKSSNPSCTAADNGTDLRIYTGITCSNNFFRRRNNCLWNY